MHAPAWRKRDYMLANEKMSSQPESDEVKAVATTSVWQSQHREKEVLSVMKLEKEILWRVEQTANTYMIIVSSGSSRPSNLLKGKER
ncbi:hypothetical protein JHK82_012132 [Glycine max]|uniref:Uncharacterized protein n=1 Tax=Glycine soja TaxID=3848 RepID=A0A0B2NWJ6_GLYSO|nr:hypothetical protein JHK85_012459 [Glycine max]KAG5057133.1 hypothetical protein JHK86_012129 [Glycine max]KAG5154163.1 hypothetical protein JHK82_012132 [Glycine max]KHN01531.1 hypothetical protein glysoja_041208 [Glycine soja]